MIFGKNAGLMLKYQKAKAKMVEYDVSKQEYPHFPLNSNELSYPTTYVLSRYSECIIENNHDELKELELLLITTAEYYDSAFKSKDRPEYDWDFLLDYAKKLEKAYLKVNPKRTQNLIVQEILLRQDIISNIENYLCLVRSAETLVNDSKKSAVDICTNTLAYAMATEKEKELLIKVFQKIEENIQQYSVEKLSRYSNAMSGIGLSSLIEEWIVQNELTEKIYTETELLYVITELYLQICGDFRYQEHIQSICKKWIDGQTPMEINNKETIGIAEVESLCNKRISYEMNFLIGNICDLIEVDGENEEQVDQRNSLTLLQKKVKYGVPNMTAISICESVFNDRLLAIELAQILSDANIGTDKILNMLKAHSEEIFSCLDSYPEYFKDRLSVLMK